MPLALARGYDCKDLEALAKIGVSFWLKPNRKLIVKNGLKPIPIEFMQKTTFVLLQGLFPDLVGVLTSNTYKVNETLQEEQKADIKIKNVTP